MKDAPEEERLLHKKKLLFKKQPQLRRCPR